MFVTIFFSPLRSRGRNALVTRWTEFTFILSTSFRLSLIPLISTSLTFDDEISDHTTYIPSRPVADQSITPALLIR